MMTRLVSRCWLAGSIVLAACSAPSGVSVDRGALSGAGDIVLERALRPRSGERIDCKGRTIRGAPVLMYLLEVENVTVENCVFKDAAFGVMVAGGGGHQFRANRFENIGDTAVQVVTSNGNEFRDNVLEFVGGGFVFNGNADHNRVHHNVIRAGLGVGAYWTPSVGVINVVVDGELTQFLNEDDMLDDLRIWENDIALPEDGFAGITLNGRTRDGRAWNNKVRGGAFGLMSAGYWGTPVVLPGRCSRDATRRCTPEDFLDERTSDCFIPGVDKSPKGTCVGAQFLDGETGVIRSTFANNVVSGAGSGIEIYLAPSTRVEGNDVSSCYRGILIGDFMLESGTVVGNVVRGNQIGFAIDNELATYAGAEIAFNDFVDNVEPDHTHQICWDCPETYQLATDLSLNYWGLTCAQGGAPAFNDPDLTASRSYGAPVAEAYRAAVKAGGAIDPAALGTICD